MIQQLLCEMVSIRLLCHLWKMLQSIIKEVVARHFENHNPVKKIHWFCEREITFPTFVRDIYRCKLTDRCCLFTFPRAFD